MSMDATIDDPPPKRDRGWTPPMPAAVEDSGVSRVEMWRALPQDGAWVTLKTWRKALGLEHVYHAQFGQAITAADVSERRVHNNKIYYRRRQLTRMEAAAPLQHDRPALYDCGCSSMKIDADRCDIYAPGGVPRE